MRYSRPLTGRQRAQFRTLDMLLENGCVSEPTAARIAREISKQTSSIPPTLLEDILTPTKHPDTPRRGTNMRRVYDAVRHLSVGTTAELSQETGLSREAIANALRFLYNRGLLERDRIGNRELRYYEKGAIQ